MQPVLGVYAGYSLGGEYVKPGADLAPYVQDAVDEIEYVTGDAKTTKWGAVRAADGHPAPFPLRYVEIGNEDFFDKSGSYEAGRFAQFFRRYPSQISKAGDYFYHQCGEVPSSGFDRRALLPLAAGVLFRTRPTTTTTTGQTRKSLSGNGRRRRVPPPQTWARAWATPAWMCGIERNSDHVAPLIVRTAHGQSRTGDRSIGH